MKKLISISLSLVISSIALAQDYKTLDRVHPEYRDMVPNVIFDFSKPEILEQSRKSFSDAAEQGQQPTIHWVAPASGDQPAVDLYGYLPKNAKEKLPVIYFMHGGGYMIGTARQHNDLMHFLAERHQAAVISVEYRLATKAPFPADINDAYHGLSFVYKNSDKLNFDKERVVIMGNSAGGGLAARLAIYTRDKGEFKPAGQVLIYPMLDYRTASENAPFNNPDAGEFVWIRASNKIGWEALRGGKNISENAMPYFSPSLAKNLSGLPPAYIAVGDLDLFVNEDVEYANSLIQAGVSTELQVLRGLVHGFDLLIPDSEPSERYARTRDRAIEMMLSKPLK